MFPAVLCTMETVLQVTQRDSIDAADEFSCSKQETEFKALLLHKLGTYITPPVHDLTSSSEYTVDVTILHKNIYNSIQKLNR